MRPVAFALIVALGTTASAAPHATIELLPEARVAGETVTLGQVARLRSQDLALMQALVNLPIGNVPPVGQISRIRRNAVTDWLRQQPSLDGAQFDWGGAEEALLMRAATLVSGGQIAQAAVEAVQASMATSGRRGEVLVAAAPRNMHVPSGVIRLEPRKPQANYLGRRMSVWVDLWSGNLLVRTVPVTVEVLLAQSQAQEPTTSTRATHAPTAAIPHPRASREDAAPAVIRGQWASLRSTTGVVVLESRVEVLQDGRPGERVRVRQQGATAGLFARVLAGGVLELVP